MTTPASVAGVCPAKEQLSAYSLGTLAPDEITVIAAHLETCPNCLQRLQHLDEPADSLVRSLIGLHSVHFAPSVEDQRIIAHLTGVGSEHSARSERSPQLPPDQIGPYDILQSLGEGGMGTVYKARHRHLGKIVALKLLSAQRGADAASLARFMQEMKAVGQLSHPNIVQAHDAGVEVVPYLAMEFLEGMDLSHYVQEHGPLTVPRACECVRQAAVALQYAFTAGLVHRDIKPSNLLLTPEGTVKLLDLGLARLGADRPRSQEQPCPDGTLTSTGAVMGTIDYIAPEQLRDSRTVDIRADLYSLGCTLYFLLTGVPPFSRKGEGSISKQRAHLSEPAPDVRVRRPDVPLDLGVILERLLAKNPEYRFVSPAELCAALEPFATGCSLRGLTGTTEGPCPVQASLSRQSWPSPSFVEKVEKVEQPPTESPPWALWTAGLIFLLVVGLGFWVLDLLPDWGRVSSPQGTPRRTVKPLIETFQVDHFRSVGGGLLQLGTLGTKDVVRPNQDSFSLTTRLSEPAYQYLIAYLPSGRDFLCWPNPPDLLVSSQTLTYPREGLLPIRESGLHVFVLVIARQPLPPYEHWRTGPVTWPENQRTPQGAWKFDGNHFTALTRDLPAPAPQGFKELCGLLAARPEVNALQAVAFYVLPDELPNPAEPKTTDPKKTEPPAP